jgi:flagellar hook-basal body complex protein FliE
MMELRDIGGSAGLGGLLSARPSGGPRPSGPIDPDSGPSGTTSGAASGEGFGATLGKALTEVNRLQMDAQQAASALAAGEANVADVVVTTQKADIAFQLTLQIRNKLLEAYQDVMRMQV